MEPSDMDDLIENINDYDYSYLDELDELDDHLEDDVIDLEHIDSNENYYFKIKKFLSLYLNKIKIAFKKFFGSNIPPSDDEYIRLPWMGGYLEIRRDEYNRL